MYVCVWLTLLSFQPFAFFIENRFNDCQDIITTIIIISIIIFLRRCLSESGNNSNQFVWLACTIYLYSLTIYDDNNSALSNNYTLMDIRMTENLYYQRWLFLHSLMNIYDKYEHWQEHKYFLINIKNWY